LAFTIMSPLIIFDARVLLSRNPQERRGS